MCDSDIYGSKPTLTKETTVGKSEGKVTKKSARPETFQPSSSTAAQFKKPGRPSNAVLLQKQRSNSWGSMEDYTNNKKRSRNSDSSSPPENLLRKKSNVAVNTASSVTVTEATGSSNKVSSSMEAFMQEIREMNSGMQGQIKALSLQVTEVSAKHDANLLNLREELNKSRAEYLKAHKELEKRIDELEKSVKSNSSSMDKNLTEKMLNIEKKLEQIENKGSDPVMTAKLDDLVNKLERRERNAKQNNIVIRGLNVDSANPKRSVATFLENEFGLNGSIIEIRRLNSQTSSSSLFVVKLDSWREKQRVFKEKKNLLNSPAYKAVYIEQDLSYKERGIAKKIREAAKKI